MYHLIRSDQEENRWGAFAGELLRSEGLSGFRTHDLDRDGWPALGTDSLILLTRCWLRRQEIADLLDAVESGARLVVIQPQRSLAEGLGLDPASTVCSPASIHQEGNTLQSHQPLAVHRLTDEAHWSVLATASGNAESTEADPVPAVVERSMGRGKVACFFYDVAGAVAAIRFGDPELMSLESLTWSWPHAADMYCGHIDAESALLPQADLHSQLLAASLTRVSPLPLARVWYYETVEQTTVGVLQSDGDHSLPTEFEALARAVEARGGTATFYLMETTKLDEAAVSDLRQRGHSFGPHANPRAVAEEMHFAIPEALRRETQAFRERFGESSATLQCHCAPWTGTTTHLPVHIDNGYRLLFAHLSLGDGLWARYLCGSTRPLRFASTAGEVFDCWQQPVAVYDDQSVMERMGESRDAVLADVDRYLDGVFDRYHSPVAILSHPVSFCQYSQPVMEHCFDRLQAAGAPIVNADQWLDFTDRRDALRVCQTATADGALVVEVSDLCGDFTLLLPNLKSAAVRVNGETVEGTPIRRFGRTHLAIALHSQAHGSTCRIEITGGIDQ